MHGSLNKRTPAEKWAQGWACSPVKQPFEAAWQGQSRPADALEKYIRNQPHDWGLDGPGQVAYLRLTGEHAARGLVLNRFEKMSRKLGAKPFADAIESIFRQTEVQLCIVHQIRNSQKYMSWKDIKTFMKELQTVYKATTKEQAERNLDLLETNWGQRYPKVIESWRKHWPRLSNYFQYNKDIRRIMYHCRLTQLRT